MESNRFLHTSTLVLALLSTPLLAFNMLAMPLCKQEVFFERDIFSGVEVVILVGFGLIFLFNIMSLLWVFFSRVAVAGNKITRDVGTLALGVLCLILMFGEKVMIDKMGREYLLGWEVHGEWIILYIELTLQLVYNFVVLLRLFRGR